LLLNKLGISNVWYDEYKATPDESKKVIWHPKKCAEIKVDGKEIGFLGEISQKIFDGLDIPAKVVLFDIDFEKLSNLTSEEHEYRPISRFPAAVRDIAVLVPRLVRIEEVLNEIERAGGGLIRDIDLFDIYEGEELPQGKKNLAFHLIFQSEDRTLSSKEIDEKQDKIIRALERKPGWQVRK
jgi:phenylalanyl-tRNA synthetase beta chain